MGSSESKGAVLIACDQVSILPGSEITGHIYLQLNKNLHKNTKLLIVFSGSESIEWALGVFDEKKEKKNFKKESKEIFSWDDGLSKGQYDFPFAFLLPETLHPSFQLFDKKYHAKVEYYIQAELLSKSTKLENSANIEILSRDAPERVPLGIYKELSFKSCFQKYTISLKGQLNSNIYFSQENLTFELLYQTAELIKDVQVSLVRKVLLKSKSHGAKFFTKTLFSKSFPRISDKPLLGTFSLSKHGEELSKAKSFTCTLISCKYFLIISQSTNSTCSQVLESVENEIMVYSNESFIVPLKIESPEDWNPQSFPVARMSFKEFVPSAPEYIEDN